MPWIIKNNGGYELFYGDNIHKIEELDNVNKLISPYFDDTVFTEVSDKIDAFKFNKDHVLGLVKNKYEGQIHTGKNDVLTLGLYTIIRC